MRSEYDSALSAAAGELRVGTQRGQTALHGGAGISAETPHSSESECETDQRMLTDSLLLV